MARVCTGCGLTTDDQGRLIVNTGDATWDLTCSYVNGIPIVCGPDGVLRLSEPQRLHTRQVFYSSALSGQITSATFGSPVIGGATANFGLPLEITIDNSDGCLPMRVAARHGIHHAALGKTGAGDTRTQYGTTMTISGSVVDVTDAHQQWGHDGSVTSIVFDAMNSTRFDMYTVPAGGSALFSAQRYISVASYNGNTTLTNHQAVIDIEAWHA